MGGVLLLEYRAHRMDSKLLQLVFLNFVIITFGKEESKPVTIALNSGWTRTTLLSEAR